MSQVAQTAAIAELARRRRKVAGICAVLVVLVLMVFGQTVRHAFVNYDDDQYVYENLIVTKGLSLENIGWALTHVHAGNWHPLTTMSHMLDCQLYGLNPWGHHLSNVGLHALAVVLLFLMLREMTGFLWRSAFVAAVFAIHPLRVESVAWVAERKDLLSGVFFMLTLWTYTRYCRSEKSWGRYALVMLWFVLGLMSKPMLVTLPFVMLLLDYWPLGRLQQVSQFPRLLREKLPLFALSILSCVATVIAQKGAIAPLENVPLSLRIGNAVVAYAAYLGKMIYPARLAVLYPMSKDGWSAWQVIAALLLLTGLSAVAWLLRRKQPYLMVGWLWYLGMLVPVIGILQVGLQAYADRYSYLPQIGLYLAVSWALADWAGEKRWRRVVLGGLAGLVLNFLLVTAYRQTIHWRDNESLWTHTLGCTQDNAVAHINLGKALLLQGRTEEAASQFREVLRINPDDAGAHCNLGNAMQRQGRMEEALAQYHEALRINPEHAETYNNLGNAMQQQGRFEEAITNFREALRMNPASAETHTNLGNALLKLGRTEEATARYHEALRINPAFAEAHNSLGNAMQQQGRGEEAEAQYREVLRINPAHAEARNNLGNLLFQLGRPEEAIMQLQKALELQNSNLAIQNNLAWLLATVPQRSLRQGSKAVELATQANQSTGGNNPLVLHTLAAAYAEAGRFGEAVQTARHALQLAESQSNQVLAAKLRRELQLYEAGQSFQAAP